MGERREERIRATPLLACHGSPFYFLFFYIPARLRDSTKVEGITTREVATNTRRIERTITTSYFPCSSTLVLELK